MSEDRAPVYVLGVNTGPHDGSAALLRDGELVAMVEQERLSRNRYARGEAPRDAIDACLVQAGIGWAELNRVAVGWDVPRLCEIEGVPYDEKEFREWLGDDTGSVDLQFVSHHIAHAASAFYTSGRAAAAIIVADGRGEDVATTLAVGGPGGIEVIRTWGVEASLGHLYGWSADWAGLSHWGAGKLMGLAAYGRPTQPVPLVAGEDGYDIVGGPSADYPVRHQFLLARRFLRSQFRQANYPFSSADNADVLAYADFAASVQHALEQAMLSLARLARRETGLDHLVLAGGVALNCTANGKIHRSGIFEEIWVPPVPHDAGVSLGAALVADRAIRGMAAPPPRLAHAFWSPTAAGMNARVRELLNDFQVDQYAEDELVDVVARDLADGLVVGWARGRAEVGQRALGARSILCDPRSRKALVRVNKIKDREPWRPLAPVLPVEEFNTFFDGPLSPLANFMLGAWPVRDSARSRIPAAVHVDGSARPQVVGPEHSAYYGLLRAFEKLTGVPVLINTSLNIAGEPMVYSAADAVDSFVRSDIDVLVLDDLVIRRPRRPSPSAVDLVDGSLSFTPWHART